MRSADAGAAAAGAGFSGARGLLGRRRVPRRGCGIGAPPEHGPTPNGQTRTPQAGPGRAIPASSGAVQRAGSGPCCPPALRRGEPSVPGSCPGVSGVIPVSPRRDCKYTHTHTGTGARFYFIVLSVKMGRYPLKNFPEPMSSLELLVSSPCPGLSQQAPRRGRAAAELPRPRTAAFPRVLPLCSSRCRRVCIFVSRAAPSVWFSR